MIRPAGKAAGRSWSRVAGMSRTTWGATLGSLAMILARAAPLPAQTLEWEDYRPISTLVVEEHHPTRARFPFVDVHSHHPTAWEMTRAQVDSLVAQMDAMNMRVAVNLSGGSGDQLRAAITNLEGPYPSRFVVFANLDYDGIGSPGWGSRAATQLEADVQAGARGLKIFKDLGLFVTDVNGDRVPVNHAQLDAVWRKAGELGIPVLIHTGDPAPFWKPQDRYNERWFELKERPNRRRSYDDPMPFEDLMAEQHDVFARHPGTAFIAAHLDWLGNDLGRLGGLLDRYPNVSVELGAVLAELGRQPRTARRFFLHYSDRILMGKDAWAPEEYHVYFRTLETPDEYIPYYRLRHAFWRMYGLDLPDWVLERVYWRNAARLIPGLDSVGGGGGI